MSDPMTPPSARGAGPTPRPRKRGLFELLAELPDLVSSLVQREIELLKTEVVGKLKALGLGAGLLAAAAIVLLFTVGTLLTAAILGLSVVMPGWLAALLVSLVLLVIAGVIGFIGYKTVKRGMPPVPTESIESVRRDVMAIRGLGKRETP